MKKLLIILSFFICQNLTSQEIVVDSTGAYWTDTSGVVLVWPSAVIPFNPSQISGLKLWLNASNVVKDGGNAISSVTDLSGNGNDAVQASAPSQPLWVDNSLNGKPVIRFDGTNDFLRTVLSQTYTYPATFFVVWHINSDANSQNIAFSFNTNDQRIHQTMANGVGWYQGMSAQYVSAPTPFIMTACATITAGTNMNFYTNGNFRYNENSGGSTNLVMPLTIGGYYGGGYVMKGDIAEIIYYNTLLSDTDRLLVETYLNTKYAIY